MAGYLRQLPSGLWANTIRTPAGRITESFDLKTLAANWGVDQLAQIRRGDWIDPRLAKVHIGVWRDRTRDSRHLEKASRKRDESHWRCHVGPRWASTPLGAVLRPDVSARLAARRHADPRLPLRPAP